jgi:glycosyltransferase involved in cell wall biosynthesis
MKENSLISIIIPAYNAEKYLTAALESVCRQTYDPLEILVINDGSTDQTKDIADNYAEKDDRIRVIHIANQGVSHARNLGIEEASGDYLFFLDADDYLESEAMEQYMQAAVRNDADIVTAPYFELLDGGIMRIRSRVEDYREELKQYKDPLRLFLNTDFIIWGVWGKLFRRSAIGEIRFAEEIRVAEDLLFTESVLQNCHGLGVVPTPQYIYRVHASSVMGQKFSKKNLDTIKVLNHIRKELMDTEYCQDADGFYLKYSIWFVGSFLRTCPAGERKKYETDMQPVLDYIRSIGCPYAKNKLSRKKQLEFCSIKLSPSVYAAWITLAYRMRDIIWNHKRKRK